MDTNGTHLDHSSLLDLSTDSFQRLDDVLESDQVQQLLSDSKNFESLAASILHSPNDSGLARSDHSKLASGNSSVHVATVQERLDLVDALDSLVTQLTYSHGEDNGADAVSDESDLQPQSDVKNVSPIKMNESSQTSEHIYNEHSYSRPVASETESIEPLSESSTPPSPSCHQKTTPFQEKEETFKSSLNELNDSAMTNQSQSASMISNPSEDLSSSTTSSTCKGNSVIDTSSALSTKDNVSSDLKLSESSPNKSSNSLNISTSSSTVNSMLPQRRSQRQIERVERSVLERIKAENQELMKRGKEQVAEEQVPKDEPNVVNTPTTVTLVKSPDKSTSNSRPEPSSGVQEKGSNRKRTISQQSKESMDDKQIKEERPVKRKLVSKNGIKKQPDEDDHDHDEKEEEEVEEEKEESDVEDKHDSDEEEEEEEEEDDDDDEEEEEKDEQDDDSGEDWQSDDDPEKLWCVCRQPHNNRFMICCDQCEDWFHGTCVGVTRSQGAAYEKEQRKWYCTTCREQQAEERRLTSSVTKKQRVEPAQRSALKSKAATTGKRVNKQVAPTSSKEKRRKSIDSIKSNSTSGACVHGNSKDTQKPEKLIKMASSTETEEKKQEQALKELIKNKKMEFKRKFSSLSEDNKSNEDELLTFPISKKSPVKLLERGDSQEKLVERLSKPEVQSSPSPTSQEKVHHHPHHHHHHHQEESGRDKSMAESKHAEKKKGEDKSPSNSETSLSKPSKKEDKRKKSKEVVVDPSFNDLFKAEPIIAIPKKNSMSTNGQSPQLLSPKRSASFSESSACVNGDCRKSATMINGKSNSVYCSETCLEKYANLMVQMCRERYDTSTNKTDKHADSNGHHRLTVIDKKSGRYLSGVNAIAENKIVNFLRLNPSFEIVLPQTKRTSLSSSTTSATPTKNIKDEKRRSSTGSVGHHNSNGTNGSSASGATKQTSESSPETIRTSARKTLRKTLLSRAEQCKEIEMSRDQIKAIAYKIEEELFGFYRQVGTKYKTRYRSLVFNLGDTKNHGLYRRVLTGKLSPEKLVRMSPEEMASSELAKWRERENKHSIEMLKRDAEQQAKQVIVKKTHKGEEMIETKVQLPAFEEPHKEETTNTGSERRKLNGMGKSNEKLNPLDLLFKDTTSEHSQHLFDLHCKVCANKNHDDVPNIISQRKRASLGSVSGLEDSNSSTSNATTPVEPKRVHVELDEPTSRILEEASKLSITQVITPPIRSAEESVKNVMESDSEAKASHSLTHSASTNLSMTTSVHSCWNGYIQMQDVAKFAAFAYKICGNYEPSDIMDSIQVCGRIAPEQVFDYLKKLRYAARTEITVLRFVPANSAEKLGYDQFFTYLHYRKRFGVIGNSGKTVKDFYILPLAKDQDPPDFLSGLDGFRVDERYHRQNLLLGILVRSLKHLERSHSIDKHSESSSISSIKSSKTEESMDRLSTIPERSYTPPPSDKISKLRTSRPMISSSTAEAGGGSYTPPRISLPYSSTRTSTTTTFDVSAAEDEPYDPEDVTLRHDSPNAESASFTPPSLHDQSDQLILDRIEQTTSIEEQKRLLDELTNRVEESRRQLELQRRAAENTFSIATGTGGYSLDSNVIPGLDGQFFEQDKSSNDQSTISDISSLLSKYEQAIKSVSKSNTYEDPIIKNFGDQPMVEDLSSSSNQDSNKQDPEPMDLDEDNVEPNTILEVNNTLAQKSTQFDPRLRTKSVTFSPVTSESTIHQLPDHELVVKARLQLEALKQMEQEQAQLKIVPQQQEITRDLLDEPLSLPVLAANDPEVAPTKSKFKFEWKNSGSHLNRNFSGSK